MSNPETVSNGGCVSGITATENRIDPDSAYITLPTGLFSSKWSYLTSVLEYHTNDLFN